MPILLLVGEDNHAIARHLDTLKAKLNPDWLTCNYHRFPANRLREALLTARTPPLVDTIRLVIVEQCQFNSAEQFGKAEMAQLEQHPIPETTTLVFIATTIDKRLKIVKFLRQQGQLREFPIVPPWRTQDIVQNIANQAKVLQVPVSPEAVRYLAQAIGNDFYRVEAELLKLQVYAQGATLALKDVMALVPCQTQNSLQLAEAMRMGNGDRVVRLLHELMARSDSPAQIVATLLTQFRTWLWVKSVLADPAARDNLQIAKLCHLNNPNRLYYLRQEVAQLSLRSIVQALTLLLALEVKIKQGKGRQALLPDLISITRCFQV